MLYLPHKTSIKKKYMNFWSECNIDIKPGKDSTKKQEL